MSRRLFLAWVLISKGSFWELMKKTSRFIINLQKRTDEISYTDWRDKWVNLSPTDRSIIENKINCKEFKTNFSFILKLRDESFSLLEETVISLLKQHYPNWKLYILIKNEKEEIRLKSAGLIKDKRVVVVIVDDSLNITGDFVSPLEPGDLLHEAALLAVASSILRNPQTSVVYTDNDHITLSGEFINPHFKPDWNLDLLLGMNYLSSFCAYKRPIWEKYSNHFENLHELAINATSALDASQIVHVPYVLASIRVGDSTSHLNPPTVEVKHPLPATLPKVSVLVPTRDKGNMLKRCLLSLKEITDYPNFELIIIDHKTTQKKAKKVISEFSKESNVSIMPFYDKFNFSAMINEAAKLATGEILLLLNNDTEIIQKEWMTELVSHVYRSDVAIAGPLLLFNDHTIQHAGVHPGVGGLMGHGHKHLKSDDPGYFSRLQVAHEVAAVTGACLAISVTDWVRFGGLDEKNLPVAYNDIDLCLKVRKAGLKVIFTPHSKLIHHESVSRGSDQSRNKLKRLQKEAKSMKEKWGNFLESDPAYNPNLGFEKDSFRMCTNPRVSSIRKYLGL
jgi:GT2 family glycosyltransferase